MATWLVDAGAATGLWGVGMFLASMTTKFFGLDPTIVRSTSRIQHYVLLPPPHRPAAAQPPSHRCLALKAMASD